MCPHSLTRSKYNIACPKLRNKLASQPDQLSTLNICHVDVLQSIRSLDCDDISFMTLNVRARAVQCT